MTAYNFVRNCFPVRTIENYFGLSDVKCRIYNDLHDNEIVYRDLTFNDDDIIGALWLDYQDEVGDPKLDDNEFIEYVRDRLVDYLDDCIASGYFTFAELDRACYEFLDDEYFWSMYFDELKELAKIDGFEPCESDYLFAAENDHARIEWQADGLWVLESEKESCECASFDETISVYNYYYN